MPIKRPFLATGEFYHIVMRGANKQPIFFDEEDYFRFIHDLFEFNDEDNVSWVYRQTDAINNSTGTFLVDNSTRNVPVELKERKKRKLLVEILAFCLMPNHFHLLLKQLNEKSISKFMRKMGGYVTHINNKYERSGHLYQGRFAAVHVKNDEQLKNAFVYIHTNPMDLVEPGWKEFGIKDPKKAIEFLENYRKSSYMDYIGKKNFPSVTSREFLNNVLGGEEGCRKFLENWILYKSEIKNLGSVVLE